MRLRAGQVREALVMTPGYEFVVETDDKIYEDLEIEISEEYHLVFIKVLGERVDD